MTTPTTVRPRPSTDWASAMQMPEHTDQPALAAFILWAQEQHLQVEVIHDHDYGRTRLTGTGSSGLTRAVQPGTWVIVQRDSRDQVFIETCTPEYFTHMFEPARPLRVETYRTAIDGTLVHLASGDAEQHTAWEYRWRVVHTTNGENMASGEGYTDRRARDHAIATLWPDLEVVEADR